MRIRPSSLPMLAQCPCFESGEASEFADEGTQRHRVLAALIRCELSGNDGADVEEAKEIETLDGESREGVEWAADYIRIHAPTPDHPLRIEERVNPLDDEFKPLFENGGTRDFGCGPHVFDFKWRPRNYDAQMAAYALDKFDEGFETVTVHLLFGATRRAQVFKIDGPSAMALVTGIIERAKDPASEPTPCDYCGWCAKRLTCKPYLRVAKRVAEGYADESLLAQVKSWHPSEVVSPEEMGLMLCIWRNLLKKWGASVEFHAKKMRMGGTAIPGFDLEEEQGDRYITDTGEAYARLGLPPEKFLKACPVRLNTSKTYKDRLGLFDIYKAEKEFKTRKAAEREVEKLLSDLITTGKPTLALVATNGDGSDECDE